MDILLSKINYKSIIFFKFIQNVFMMIPSKIYDNTNYKKINNVNFEDDFLFYVCM
jgi:hypothetical protein